ncbi:putative hydroxymethylpyrimidine transport system ATP-binding protein [Cognatiyoonia sediminum]|uniref:Putative hydroxymethylpyrimidine transport system ATP-binding protein n=1 Tax=Cognatiyoonia sediminum TaxID=1508389 RepID=A0A1M5QVR3_9RHOB|nr:ABC transporter ATP-binding protein [Cognatiyoonia sediminum]SHH17830.1 putative hydroxymethylpyrimidine transport system ATP-binding protein [Cognatiyoonia sediminum]
MNEAPSITLQGSHAIDGRTLFDGITLTLPAAEWTCLLGPSGVGKSTILRLILGLDTAGTFTGSIETSDAKPLDNRISYMAQSDLLLPWLTVLENAVLGARLRDEKPDLDRAQTLLARVGLSDHQTKKPAALSGGMRQRAALARTLMEDRPIVLLDEPFSALDAGTRADMQELAAEVLTDKTVMLVTHDPGEAARMAHQIVLLTPSEAKQWPVPPIPPIRPVDAPETLSAQSELLAHMRGFRA